MPIGNITQSVSTIPAPPHRGVDVQTQFVIKQEDFQDHLQGTTVTELNTLKTQLNARIGEINSTATTMNGYATSASSSATTATTKAGEASTSATAALNSKNQASTFATNSSNSATKASQWADNNYNVAVEAGKYSAKHWSTVAQNTVNNKVDKVISTDNAVVRFDGVTGAVQNSSVSIDDNGNLLLTSGALGYGTGAGGNVTQLTSKSTAVTLNKPSGLITMNNEALAVGVSALFRLNNNLLNYNDALYIQILGPATGSSAHYRVSSVTGSLGIGYITVTNMTAGSLSEVLVLQFMIIKGAIS